MFEEVDSGGLGEGKDSHAALKASLVERDQVNPVHVQCTYIIIHTYIIHTCTYMYIHSPYVEVHVHVHVHVEWVGWDYTDNG